jgi:predicted permease
MISDLKFALRQLIKSPGFTIVAVVSLALGIGAGTAVFSLVNGILLSSLPVPNPQELRDLSWYNTGSISELGINSISGSDAPDGPQGQTRHDGFSLPAFLALRTQCAPQAEIFGYLYVSGVTARARGAAVRAESVLVSGNFFSGLGVRPLIGNLIGSEDESPGAPPVVVISYRWWAEQFALDPSVIGQQVAVNGRRFTIIGVLPREFRGVRPGNGDDLYVSLLAQPQLLPAWHETGPASWWVALMARLQPGVSSAQLQAAMDGTLRGATEALAKRKSAELKAFVSDGSAGSDWTRGRYERSLLLLLSVVGVILLVACASLSGMLLARGAARQHEFSVRIAVGASRGRLIRQLLTENLLLALLGGGLGTLIAIWGRLAISRLLAGSQEGLHYETAIDFKVLCFALAVSLVTALISGLLPALKAGRVAPIVGLKDRACPGAASPLRTGRLLVVAQIALSLLLLVGGGLYVRTLINLERIDPGFPVENLLLFKLNPGNVGYKDPQTTAYYEKVQNSLTAIPGVRSATLLQYPSLGGWSVIWSLKLPAHPENGQNGQFTGITIGDTFFPTFGIPVLLGRGLKVTDSSAAPKVVVVNQAFVRKYFPSEFPIGQEIAFNRNRIDTWQIVGVCRDTKLGKIRAEAPPTAYFSFRQKPIDSGYFVLRTGLPPLAIAAAARKTVAAIDRNIPLTDLSTQQQVLDQNFKSERTFAALCGSLAVLALLLSCIGLYGLMAYDVARRTAEIGIRQALGATRWQIAEPILRQSMVLAGTGAALGVPLALAITRVVHANLYGLEPSDPATFVAAVAVLLVVALIAVWIPARRAARVDPMVALRAE